MRKPITKQQLRAFFAKHILRKPEKVEMKHREVTSTNLASIGYHPATQIMEVRFKGNEEKPGNTYRYYNVPVPKYKALLRAKSKGKYLNRKIKPDFKYEKVG